MLDRRCEYSFIVPNLGPEGGPGDTVVSLLETVKTKSALIVLGDTHFQFANSESLDRAEPLVLTWPMSDSYRWCVAERDDRGYVRRLLNKVPNLPGEQDALIGVYYFPDVD